MFGLFRSWRRKRLTARPFPRHWETLLRERVGFYPRLPNELAGRVHDVTRVLIAEKNWEGCGGLELTEEMRVVVAAQAALLVAGLDGEYFRGLYSVLIYPDSYAAPGFTPLAGGGVIESDEPRLGEAHVSGTVVLSWPEVLGGAADPDDGRNLVFHEFAHALDMIDRYADGVPPLFGDQLDDWERVVEREFVSLAHRSARGLPSLLDAYGAKNRAEFFAVATECFFEKPNTMRIKLPKLYGVFAEFYRQDPAAWGHA